MVLAKCSHANAQCQKDIGPFITQVSIKIEKEFYTGGADIEICENGCLVNYTFEDVSILTGFWTKFLNLLCW